MTIKLKTAHEIRFSPSEDRVAFIGNRNVTVLEFPSGNPVFDVHHTAHPSHIDFSPDGSRLIVKSTSGRTKILDASNGEVLTDFNNQKEGEGAAALFSNCGKYVVSASWAGSITVRNALSGSMEHVQNYPEQKLGNLTTTSDRATFIYSVCRPPLSPTNMMMVEKHSWPFADEGNKLSQQWPFIKSLQLSPSGRHLSVVYGTSEIVHEIYESQTMLLLLKQPIKYDALAKTNYLVNNKKCSFDEENIGQNAMQLTTRTKAATH